MELILLLYIYFFFITLNFVYIFVSHDRISFVNKESPVLIPLNYVFMYVSVLDWQQDRDMEK